MADTPDPAAAGPRTMAEDPVPIAAGLGPAEAGAARDRLLEALAGARAAGAPLALEAGEGPVLPCALQLLVAARASAAAAGIPFAPGARAAAALDALVFRQSPEQEPQ